MKAKDKEKKKIRGYFLFLGSTLFSLSLLSTHLTLYLRKFLSGAVYYYLCVAGKKAIHFYYGNSLTLFLPE